MNKNYKKNDNKFVSKKVCLQITFGLILLIFSNLFFTEQTRADSDKLDLKKLEDSYWAAKDSDFSVVQNRTFTKDKKFFGSLSYGVLMNDSFSYGRMTNFATGYFFNERMGVELAREKGNLWDNDGTSTYLGQHQVAPNHNRLIDYTSVQFVFVPFYAKMSFIDRAIFYFDMQFAFGIGKMNYKAMIDPIQGDDRDFSTMGYNLDFSQQMFFSQHFAFRLDIKNKWTQQETFRYQKNQNEPESARNLGTSQHQDTTILLGITYFH